MSKISTTLSELTQKARAAYRQIALTDHETRNETLRHAAHTIRQQADAIITANRTDMMAAKEKMLSEAMLDRLELTKDRIEAMATGLEAIAKLPDPLVPNNKSWQQPNGLTIQRVPVPLGVIGVVYESRPNVTADAAGLCLKSGNAVLLRGGSESFYSSQAIAGCMVEALKRMDLPEAAIQLIPSVDRGWVNAMMQGDSGLDVLIPRGGKGLTELVQRESHVPTILHLDGNCHSYLHEAANLAEAIPVILNAKMRRTGICGATESLLIDQSIAERAVPAVAELFIEAGVEIRADKTACKIDSRLSPAEEEDWGTEYLSNVLSLKIVKDINHAIEHINHYGSHHTDAIFTEDAKGAVKFQRGVDSAIVMHNTSTQFADGGEFGMGAEIGISTGRLHARGPVGAGQLVTYKYAVTSDHAMRA
jgi:glutamate-5-semialdehyde dehydrogenase